MLAMLLATALVAQDPTPAQKPAAQDTARARPSQNAPQAGRADTTAPTTQAAFQDRMRQLWGDHITYMRNFIISSAAELGDTAVVKERLLRNQEEMGDAIKPYYGDEAGSQLTELLRGHITLATQAFAAAQNAQTDMAGGAQQWNRQNRDTTDVRFGRRDTTGRDTTRLRDPANIQGQDTAAVRGRDTTRARPDAGQPRDTTPARQNQLPGRDTTDLRVADDTLTQGRMAGAMGDTVSVDDAVQALRANADSIAAFLNKANPRHWNRAAVQSALRTHIDLLVQQVNARLERNWSADVAAFDASHKQAMQMADMLTEGIVKQFPNRFRNRTTAMSSREQR
ncbi:MAG: hypothetical protein ACREMN_01090 [Gemmatimonadales bacterium]